MRNGVLSWRDGRTEFQRALGAAMYAPHEAWWNTLPAPYLPPLSLCAVWPD
jgi:hypothetical protein